MTCEDTESNVYLTDGQRYYGASRMAVHEMQKGSRRRESAGELGRAYFENCPLSLSRRE